jgi:hypothetical protein
MIFEELKKMVPWIFFQKETLNIIYIFENIFHKIVKIHHKRNNCFQMKVS